MAFAVPGELIWALQSALKKVPPKELIMLPTTAMFSPQPGRPRMQTGETPASLPLSLAARVSMSVQVGSAGMVRPYLSKRSLRYMVNADSP